MLKTKPRRVLFSVSNKTGIVELAQAFIECGAEIVATGKTATVLTEGGIPIVPIELISGNPEAFQGRMKTLSFNVCSGILYRRGDTADEAELKKLGIQPIDAVVVNFYPFEEASKKAGISPRELIEQVDIGGPTLVRAAAKNAPDVLVLTDPAQYGAVLKELREQGGFSPELAQRAAAHAWQRVLAYDQAIVDRLAPVVDSAADRAEGSTLSLRYGENPHQQAVLEVHSKDTIIWPVTEADRLTPSELSYNNLLDLSSAYWLALELRQSLGVSGQSVVIVKHNNPCGVAFVPSKSPDAQIKALELAWEGDPVSAFGGVLVFSEPLSERTAEWLAPRFVEAIAAPGLTQDSPALKKMLEKRKKLKAVSIAGWQTGLPTDARFNSQPTWQGLIPGGKLRQTFDVFQRETLKSVTRVPWMSHLDTLAQFGISVNKALKSNAVALVRKALTSEGESFQLVGAGQGQPNRVEALQQLTIPRARRVCPDGIGECVLVSDAFFPFRDTVDVAAAAGVRWIVQPGGSLQDAESIAACDEHGIGMVFTGVRHFRH